MRGVRGKALSLPQPLVLWAGGRGPLLVFAREGCGRGDSSHTAQRMLLRAGSVRCGGCRWGAPRASVWAVWVRALTFPQPPVLWACNWGPLPTGFWCCVRVWGPALPTKRASLRSLSSVGGSSFLGTCSRAAVRCVSCVLRGLAARYARRCLAPVLVPWLRLAASLSGVPQCPLLVRRTSSGPVAPVAPVGLPVAVVPSSTPGAVAPRFTGRLPDLLGRPAENQAHCVCRWPLPRQGRWARCVSYPVRLPRWGCPWRVSPASVLDSVRCDELACLNPVTDVSGFLYRPSFDGGLTQCTGAISCKPRNHPFRVGERHAQVLRMQSCACSSWPGRAGGPPGRVFVRLTFPLTVLSFFFAEPPSGFGCPCLAFSF